MGQYIQRFIETLLRKDVNTHTRFYVRGKEVYTSIKITQEALEKKPSGLVIVSFKYISLKRGCSTIGITDGWCGDIVYFVATDTEGNISRVDVRGLSFLNWMVLEYAGQGNVVPDFPLINKSFNLSYSGLDV